MNPPPFYRIGISRLTMLAVLALVAVTVLVAAKRFHRPGRPSLGADALTFCAVRRPFVHEISVRGEVESAANVDVACEVRMRSGSWIRILEVVPDGTRVEPGDFLVRLDSTGLEAERTQQQLVVEDCRAALSKAKSKFDTAEYNKAHYEAEEYTLARKEAELALLNAEEEVRVARESLQASRRLLALGFLTPKQFQADEFALRRAETELSVAKLKLTVLETCTRPKRRIELQSGVIVGKARVRAAEASLKRNLELLADIEEQIGKCVIRAPAAGEVVLNHIYQEDHAHMVAPGEQTMERRVLVRLPDPTRMQVKALVSEEKIALVEPGVQAEIELEAFPQVKLRGQVVRVSEFPEPESWHGSAVKRYETFVRIDEPLAGMRPGLTADLSLSLQRLEDQLQVPCQAVFRRGEQNYCISTAGGRWEARPVTLGPTNGKTVVVRSGLIDGEPVLLCAAAHRDDVELPEEPAGAKPASPPSCEGLAHAEAGP